MQVRVGGHTSSGRRISRVWELTAHGRHGPEIPCAPAIVLAQKLASGETSERGAKPCLGLVRLDELEDALAEFEIETHISEEAAYCSART